jgi:hypothetical protein
MMLRQKKKSVCVCVCVCVCVYESVVCSVVLEIKGSVARASQSWLQDGQKQAVA